MACALKVPDEIVLAANILDIPVDLGDPTDVGNLEEDRESEMSDGD